MIKLAADLVPGDAINLGQGYAVVSAVADVQHGIAVLLDYGLATVLRYDIQLHVPYNIDEERHRRQEVEKERARQERERALAAAEYQRKRRMANKWLVEETRRRQLASCSNGAWDETICVRFEDWPGW